MVLHPEEVLSTCDLEDVGEVGKPRMLSAGIPVTQEMPPVA